MKKSKSKKILSVLLICFFILLILAIIRKIQTSNKIYSNIDDFSSVKEIFEYYRCTWEKGEKSASEAYAYDYYVKFARAVINGEEGVTNKNYYENVIAAVTTKANKNIRIIDNSQSIIITCVIIENDGTKRVVYEINGDSYYFENALSRYIIADSKGYREYIEEARDITVTSTILNQIIDKNWTRRNIELGTRTLTQDGYDYYGEEGYKIKTIGSNIVNIIFTEAYQEDIIDGINVHNCSEHEKISKTFGIPNFYSGDGDMYSGYKLDSCYIFFGKEEISVYPILDFNEESNNKFAELMTNTLGKINDEFINELTNIYPNYSEYVETENYIKIIYALEGFECVYAKNSNSTLQTGIYIYANCQGKITNDVTIEDVLNGESIPKGVYIRTDEDLVDSYEDRRIYYEYNPNYART